MRNACLVYKKRNVEGCNMDNKNINTIEKNWLNTIFCFYILSYILPIGKIFNIPVQKICICLFVAVSGYIFIKLNDWKSIIRTSKLEIVVLISGGIMVCG